MMNHFARISFSTGTEYNSVTCTDCFASAHFLIHKEFLAIRRAISLNETFVLFC